MAKNEKGGLPAEVKKKDGGASRALVQVREAAGLPMEQFPDERLKTIWRMAAPDANTVSEFSGFMTLCQKYELDPIAGEAWFGRIRGKPTLLTGRDTYIKVASNVPTHEGIEQGVVYEEDEFWLEREGREIKVHHRATGMGEIRAAYCVVHDADHPPAYWIARWEDYEHLADSKDTWKLYGPNMLQNRAVTSAFRLAYPLSGLHVEGEEISDEEVERALDEDTAERTRARIKEMREQIRQEGEEEEGGTEVMDAEVISESKDAEEPEEAAEEPEEAAEEPEEAAEEPEEAAEEDEEEEPEGGEQQEEPETPQAASSAEELVENGELPFGDPGDQDDGDPPATKGDPEDFERKREEQKVKLRHRQYFATLKELGVSDEARRAWQEQSGDLATSTSDWTSGDYEIAIKVAEQYGAAPFLAARARYLGDVVDLDFEAMEEVELAIQEENEETLRALISDLKEKDGSGGED